MFAHRVRYLRYLILGASASPGVRLDEEWWNEDYRRGGLSRLERNEELPRLLLVAALSRHYAPGGSILDVGCGTGGLIGPLREFYSGASLRYTGLDYSSVALRKATERREQPESFSSDGVLEFAQADFDQYEPSATFDVIIFSESLCYAPHPLKTLLRYAESLNEGGIFIVSLWRRPSRRRVWRALRGAFGERTRSRIVVPWRPSWDIGVFDRGA